MGSPVVEKEVSEKMISNLFGELEQLPKSMRAFSLAMRSLYAEKAVGGSSETAKKFQKLRDDTRNDAMVYLSGILPVTTKFISNLQEYFENYTVMSFEDWKECLDDIIAETEEHKQVANALVELHKGMLVSLKKRQDSAKVILKSMKNLVAEYEKKCAELKDSAGTKGAWAVGLAFVPFVNVIATPLLAISAESDVANAVAKCEEAKIGEAAVLTVEAVLVPALSEFITGLESATGFLNVLHQELVQFQGHGENAREDPKKLHYFKMKGKSKDIVSGCRGFYAMIPSVQTDMDAIPREGTDKNYVDKWLEEQKKIIRAKVNLPKIAAKCIDYFKSV